MRRVLSGVAIACLVLSAARVFAQAGQASSAAPVPTIDQILDKYVAALGGRAALEKITSRVFKGTVDTDGGPIAGTVEMSAKAPDKALTVITIPGIGQLRDGTDASGSWTDDPSQGIKEKTGTALADAKRGAIFHLDLKMKEAYKTLVVVGRETVGGKAAYVVDATPAEGAPTRFYFDATTGLLLRQKSRRDTPQGPVDVEVIVEDYKEVDGVKDPVTIRQVTSLFTMVIRITDIKHNVELPDAIFKKPGGPALLR